MGDASALDPERVQAERDQITQTQAFKAQKDLAVQQSLADLNRIEAKRTAEIPDKALLREAAKIAQRNYGKQWQQKYKSVYDQLKVKQTERVESKEKSAKAREETNVAAEAAGAGIDPGKVWHAPMQVEAQFRDLPYERRSPRLETPHELTSPERLLQQGKAASPSPPEVSEEYAELQDPRAIGPEAKTAGGYLGTLLWGLGAPSRGVSGGIAGAMTVLQRASNELETEAPEASPSMRAMWMGKGLPGAPPASGGRVYGIDPASALKNASLKDIIRHTVKYATEAASSKDPQSHADLVTYVQKAQRRYFGAAAATHKKQTGTTELTEKDRPAIQKIYKDMMAADIGAVESPVLTQLATELFLDPLNWVTPHKVAQLGLKIPGVAKSAGAMGDIVHYATSGFKHMPETRELTKAGGKAGEFALMAKMAPGEARSVASKFSGKSEGLLSIIRKVAPEDEELLFAITTGERSMDPELIRKATQGDAKRADAVLKAAIANKELGKLHQEFRSITGTGRRWGEGDVLEPSRQAEDYVPRRLSEKGEDVESARRAGTKTRPNIAVPESAQARTDINVNWKRDVAAQWEAEVGALTTKGQTAHDIRQTAKYAGETDMVTKLRAGTDETTVQDALKLRKLETGVEWVRMDDHMSEAWTRLTGTAGKTKKGKDVILVPRAVEDHIKAIAPIARDMGVSKQKLMTGLKAANDYVYKPYMRAWRTLKTTARPAFAPRNLAGSFGLNYLAHGIKGFGPKTMEAATATALMGAGFGTKKFRNMKYTLKGGEETTFGKLVDIMDRVGMVNQLQLKVADDVFGKGIGGAAVKGLDAATRKLGLRSAAEVTENFQHTIVFLNFLEDTTNKGIAKATDLTAKYASDYSRLGSVERSYLKNMIGFYSWAQFAIGRGVSQVWENPKRMADFVKARQAWERENGKWNPFIAEGVPSYQKDISATAGRKSQPRSLQHFMDKWKLGEGLPPPASQKAARMMVEDPITMTLYWLPMLEGTMKGGFKNLPRDADLYSMMGPALQMGLSAVTGKSAEGEAVNFMDVVKGVPKKLVDSQTRAFASIYKLLAENDMMSDAARVQAIYAMYRQWGPAGLAVEQMLPEEQREGIPGLWPFTSTQVSSPVETATRQSSEVMKTHPLERKRQRRSQ